MAKPRSLLSRIWGSIDFRAVAICTSGAYGVLSFGDDVLRHLRRKAEARAEEKIRAEMSK